MDFSLIIHSLYSSTNHCKQFNVHLIVNFVDRPASLNTVESFSFVGANFVDFGGFAESRGCIFMDESVFSFSKKT